MGVQPAGLAARDTLRLEMGFCLYGNDINETTSPLEAGLGWITKFTEGNNFINRAALEQQKANGVSKRLVGFELLERGIPRQHYPILDLEGQYHWRGNLRNHVTHAEKRNWNGLCGDGIC